MSVALDYLSPLPPVRSGISDYSVDLLPRLAELTDVRVLRLEDQEVAPDLVARWRPEPAARCGEGGRLPLYQMGNNRYHAGVRELALERPGVMTLHDLVLHHFLLDRTMGHGDFEGYRAELAVEHGWLGEAVARPVAWGGFGEAAQFALAAHRTLVRRQRGVLVHSAWAAERLREEVPGLAVCEVPMGIPLPPEADRGEGLALRRRFGIPDGAPLLGSFGFQTPIKRTEVAIRALAAPGLERAHLLIAGEESPYVFYEREAEQAGVAARVHRAGFLDYTDLEAAIAACDLALNLRYPTAGETSASLLRVLAVGRAVIVSDFGQFGELPDEVAVHLPLGEGEERRLASALARLLAEPGRLRAMGAAARRYVAREHDPAAAAAAIVAACQDLARRSPLGDEPLDLPAPTTLTWGDLPGELSVRGAELPWREGERRQLALRLENRSRARWLSGERGAGGVVVELKLLAAAGDLLAGRPWLALPRDLAPGETIEMRFEVRRPLGPARLRIEPHVLGAAGFAALGGPVWEREL